MCYTTPHLLQFTFVFVISKLERCLDRLYTGVGNCTAYKGYYFTYLFYLLTICGYRSSEWTATELKRQAMHICHSRTTRTEVESARYSRETWAPPRDLAVLSAARCRSCRYTNLTAATVDFQDSGIGRLSHDFRLMCEILQLFTKILMYHNYILIRFLLKTFSQLSVAYCNSRPGPRGAYSAPPDPWHAGQGIPFPHSLPPSTPLATYYRCG